MINDEPSSKRTRRIEPITRRSAKNGAVSYTFQVDTGARPDGSRERQRFTFPTLAEARREYRKIATEVSAGTFVRRDRTTVADYLTKWLESRRDIRPNTLAGYRHSLKPVIDHLGTIALQQLQASDIDALVTLRLNGTAVTQRDKRGRRAAEVLAFLRERSDGAQYGEILTALGKPGIQALTGWWPPVTCCDPSAAAMLLRTQTSPTVPRFLAELVREQLSPCSSCCRQHLTTP